MHSLREAVTASQIAAMAPGLRRYAEARHVDAADVDDLVQETIARLLEVRGRLDVDTAFAYALAVLTNLDRSVRRGEDVARRHRHRLLDLDGPTSAEDTVIRAEQQRALLQALDALPVEMRELLAARYDADAEHPPSSGAHAARLARARARLRLEYLIALRRVSLPDQRCHSVLVSISERDARRQTELGAGRHISSCPVCMSLCDPLLRRESRLFVLWPLLGAAAIARKAIGAHPVVATGAGLVTAGAVTTAVVLALPSAPHHSAPRPSALCRMTEGSRDTLVGQRVSAHAVLVTKVPANEGFFVRTCSGRSVWVHLQGHGESPTHVTPHAHVTISGTVRRTARGEMPSSALSAADKAIIRHAGVELVVPYRAIRKAP